jgi:L-histidine N-alpha-methyltransferase
MLVSGRPPSAAPLDLHLIDVSATALDLSSRTLSRLPNTQVFLHKTSYEAGLIDVRAARQANDRTLVLCLGSNIGNFDPPSDEAFLREIRASLRPGDSLLLGTDLVKPAPALMLAYDDPLGVTAAFNRNLLVRMNNELDGDFDLSAFAHRAVWNAKASRIEMHLVSLRRQAVRVAAAELEFTLEQGESIWTESSYKYDPGAVRTLLESAGFSLVAQWINDDDPFALTIVEPA